MGDGEGVQASDIRQVLPLSPSPPHPFPYEPRAAYIHVPFCRHRCGYCNFTLVAGRDDLVEAYLEALARELSWLEQPRPVGTLFFGGGTPTHLPPQALGRLLTLARQWFVLAKDSEFSVEANPADLDDVKAEVLAAAGVTRISLGAQSFHAPKLRLLERDHDARQIERAFLLARRVAASVSLDLIFGVPGESLTNWQRDLQLALALAPDHLSTYGLTLEKGTAFWSRAARGEFSGVDEDTEREMYEWAIDQLTAKGYDHYEVSNFARPGHRCRHNETYWLGGSYFAAGPGAARFLNGRREMNHRSTTTYIRRVLAGQSPVAESEELSGKDAARERLVFALRRLEGIILDEFEAATGHSVSQLLGNQLATLTSMGLLDLTAGRLKLTRAGLLVSDSIWGRLLKS